jgi:hypothetical protein
MDRLVLSDAAWERMAPLIIGRPDQKGSAGPRQSGCLWKACCVSCVRALSGAIFRRRLGLEQRVPALQVMEHEGRWWRIFETMSNDLDFEYLIIDSTIVRAHQHAPGAEKGDLKIRRSAARAVA